MFNSTGNNFGAGTIQFRDYQTENYVVLNARFDYDPTDAGYLAADVLEIYVPDLTIERSAVAGVFMMFKDRYENSTYTLNNDGGTVLKSWVKDKNTLCIEKLTNFDEKGEITIFIQALYTKKNLPGNTIKGTKTNINFQQETKYLYWTSDTFCVIFEHWVFLHMQFRNCSYAYSDSPWEGTMQGFPTDVNADLPFPGGSNQHNPSVTGMSIAHVENGVFTCQTRESEFSNSGYNPFIFAFLVRDGE